ncbi:MAG: hypothetical protein SF052_20500 [Bacteroidia bacterium]|nr:hypothetical protein [Bacteroidia bacterium]
MDPEKDNKNNPTPSNGVTEPELKSQNGLNGTNNVEKDKMDDSSNDTSEKPLVSRGKSTKDKEETVDSDPVSKLSAVNYTIQPFSFSKATPIEKDFLLESDFYARIGFFRAIHARTNLDEVYREIKAELETQKAELINNLDQVSNEESDRLKERIEEKDKRVLELKNEIDTYRTKLLEWETDEIDTQLALDKIRLTLSAAYKELSEGEGGLVKKRIDKVKESLDKMVLDHKERNSVGSDPSRKRHGVDSVRKISENIFKRYEKVQHLVEELNLSGIQSYIFTMLSYFGYVLALAAGWFFSVYVYFVNQGNLELSSEAYFTFIFKNIFSLGSKIPEGTKTYVFFQYAIYLLIFLAGIGLIAWIAQMIINRYKVKQYASLSAEYDSAQQDISIQAAFKSDNFFLLWFQILPLLVFVGGGIILIAVLGISSTDLDKLDNSVTAIAVGSSIAFGIAGIFYLYLTKIIEPRILKSDPKSQGIGFWKMNWEISVIVCFGIVTTFLLFALKGAHSSVTSGLLLTHYLSIALTAGGVIGYSLRYRGLLYTEDQLKSEYLNISAFLEELSEPSLLSLFSQEGKEFKYGMLKQYRQLYEMMLQENALVNKIVQSKNEKKKSDKDEEDDTSNENSKRIYFKLPGIPGSFSIPLPNLRKWFGRKNKLEEGPAPASVELNEHIDKFFPELKFQISNLEHERSRLEMELFKIRREIEALKQNTTEYEERRRQAIKDREQTIARIKRNRIGISMIYKEEVNRIEKAYIYHLAQVQDGIELAKWNITNGLVS